MNPTTTATSTLQELLDELTGGDSLQAVRFLNEPRREWLGLTPTSLISIGKESVVKDFLERMLHGEVLGG